MKYLKHFETYTDKFLVNAPSESTIKDWFIVEFEDNKDFDLEDVTVTKIEIKTKSTSVSVPGILYYEYEIQIRQDFRPAFDPIYNSKFFLSNINHISGTVDECGELAKDVSSKIINKFAKKYNLIIKNSSTFLVSDFNVVTEVDFYFRNIKTYEDD